MAKLSLPIALIAAAVILLATGIASAQQAYPSRPLRLIVPSAPGGSPDINARELANELSRQMAQQVVVENRPGASGILGYELFARATPDGYTFAYGWNARAIRGTCAQRTERLGKLIKAIGIKPQ